MADFDTFERRLNDYLAQTAKEWASEAPESGADISALRLSSIKLRSRKSVLVDFDGPDVDVYWSCEYAGSFEHGEIGLARHAEREIRAVDFQ